LAKKNFLQKDFLFLKFQFGVFSLIFINLHVFSGYSEMLGRDKHSSLFSEEKHFTERFSILEILG
jgi:hypothetical protein